MSSNTSNIQESFLAAYDQYSGPISRHCSYRVYDRERGKDLMQEVFLRGWEYLAKGAEVQNMRAFLYRIAGNLIIDESRKKRSVSLERMQEQGFDPGKDETEQWKRRIDRKWIISMLGQLDQGYRDILVMRYVHDLSPSEIAENKGMSANTVSVRIYRGLKQLRTKLEK